MSSIEKVTDQIIKELEAGNWLRADRLQLVFVELVKVEIANIEAGKL